VPILQVPVVLLSWIFVLPAPAVAPPRSVSPVGEFTVKFPLVTAKDDVPPAVIVVPVCEVKLVAPVDDVRLELAPVNVRIVPAVTVAVVAPVAEIAPVVPPTAFRVMAPDVIAHVQPVCAASPITSGPALDVPVAISTDPVVWIGTSLKLPVVVVPPTSRVW